MNSYQQNQKATSAALDMPVSANAASALSYFFGLFALIALHMKPYDRHPLVRYHAWQALLFHGGCFLAFFVTSIATGIMSAIAGSLLSSLQLYSVLRLIMFVPSMIGLALSLALFVTWVIAMVNAFQGKRLKLPVIGHFADRLATQ